MSKVFIIAEAGVNHDGDESRALELVAVAAACGADAVKFQTFAADKLVARGTAKAAYQEAATGEGDQHSMLRRLELSPAAFARIAAACSAQDIEFMSTPFDEEAADLLVGLGMRRIKVPSGELTNLPFLRFLAAKGLPLILSTGMADMTEIGRAVEAVRETWRAQGLAMGPEALTVLHCTSNYPADVGDVNLRAMGTIAEGVGTAVGYSDHTLGVAVSVAAAALGATVIEKHFTLDKGLPGPDHKASLDPGELRMLVKQVRAVEVCLGSASKGPTPSELPIRALVRRSVTLARDLPEGSALRSEDLVLLRPGTGIEPDAITRVVGRRLRRALTAGSTLDWSDLG